MLGKLGTLVTNRGPTVVVVIVVVVVVVPLAGSWTSVVIEDLLHSRM